MKNVVFSLLHILVDRPLKLELLLKPVETHIYRLLSNPAKYLLDASAILKSLYRSCFK